ncbi:MAG: response regulator [Oscillospiraceae bacterium]|jgi:PAS domain S-box-containing protein|nr:response regulator [Oscillospiraceae bacterium]MCI9579771.1 response regulator [Oscillospiraceae bacterium]
MYHCHLTFYFIGRPCREFEILREMPPLEAFTHRFLESEQPQKELLDQADVIFAAAEDVEVQALLPEGKDQVCILLARPELFSGLAPYLPRIQDVWTLPMGEEEVRFRFLRWQQACKEQKESWQTSQYLEAAINSIPSLIWYKDKDGVHEKVNDSFCRTVNKTKEQVEGQRHAYIWDVEFDDPVCIESERQVMEREETLVSEEEVQTGGDTRLLTTYKSPLYDLDGTVMGTVGVGIDITQERAYERDLVAKNRALEQLFTTLDCGIMCHSIDGSHIVSINRAALDILGYSSMEELVGSGFDMVAPSIVDEDSQKLREAILNLKKVGESVNVRYRVRHKNGRLLHVMGSIKLMEEEGERFFQRFLLDVTAQKLREDEERLREEHRQMELVQALSIDFSLVCVFDLETGAGKALRISNCDIGVLKRVFDGELNLEECMEQYIHACVYGEDQDALRQSFSRENLREQLNRRNLFFLNYRTVCKGEIRYFQMKAVRTGFWKDVRTVVLGLRNVDEETRREMEKKTLLEDALSQANRASKAKSIFLSNMSHDIRTPMNAIMGFTTLAITHIDQRDQVEEYLKKILTSGNHLVSLINDVLDMSRIESGKMHLEESLCSLPDILHGLRSIVQADIQAKQLDLYIDAVDVLNEDIYCDRLRLNQILLNLLGNSIKYTSAGGIVSLRIREKPGAPEGCAHYEFYIKDTGIGMSQEFVAHIFEPFERERNSTISGIQGTGLGMAITKNIVDMMNGAIEVHSEQGVGTEFVVSLTFRLHDGPKKIQVIPELKGCRALVVDDDFNTCDSVSYMLQQIGLRAEWTLSGREAVLRTRQAVMRGDSYSVYIIDWLMPDMNGVEVARRIRKETGDDVPIIVLTAYDWSDIEDEAREAGVTAFCSKPLFLSELRSCLCSVVGSPDEQQKVVRPVAERRTGRILLAEDNELNQEIAVAILGEAGFTTDVAGNGQRAVEMLQNSEPGYYQLILMDVQMPVLDGYGATKAIRALEDRELASIPILAMTANAFEEDRRRAIQCGMNGHIAKPINLEKMFETLNQILS